MSSIWAIIKLIQGLIDLFKWGEKEIIEKAKEDKEESRQELDHAQTEDEIKKAAKDYLTRP